MKVLDERFTSAAKYWISRPGNWTLAAVFDEEDARQEAALALLEHEHKARSKGQEPTELTWSALYLDIQDAARKKIPGYRQRNLATHCTIHFYDCEDIQEEQLAFVPEQYQTPDNAERLTLLFERLRILQSLPEQEIAMIEGWLAGEEDKVVGARYGVKGPAWCWRRKRLFDRLTKRGL